MKKLFFASAVLGLAVFATSCKKDRTCKCTVDGESYSYEIPDSKKSDAEDACDVWNSSASLVGGSCELE